MFVLDQSDTYTWPVTIEYPDEGRFKKASFDGEFKRLEEPKIEEIRNKIRASLEDPEAVSDVEIAREVLVGWSGINDGTGNEIPFSEAALGRLLKRPMLPKYIVRAWLESLAGTKSKN